MATPASPVVSAPASKPATPAPAPATISMTAHIIHLALFAAFVFGGFHIYDGIRDKYDALEATQQQKSEGVDTTAQAALLAQLQTEEANAEVRDAQQTALMQSLVAQLKASQAQTVKQIATDMTLDVKSAAQRLVDQTHYGSGDVSIVNGDVAMSLPLTRTVITDLDLLPQAQASVTNLQGQLTAEQTIEADKAQQLTTAQQTIGADKTELVATVQADNAACQVRLDTQAKAARKRSLWLTILGVAGGAVLRSVL